MWLQCAFAAVAALCFSEIPLAHASQNMYCGAADCYAVLGVTSESSSSQIRKAFYELSLKL